MVKKSSVSRRSIVGTSLRKCNSLDKTKSTGICKSCNRLTFWCALVSFVALTTSLIIVLLVTSRHTDNNQPTFFHPTANDKVGRATSLARSQSSSTSPWLIGLIVLLVVVFLLLLIYMLIIPIAFRHWRSKHYNLLFDNKSHSDVNETKCHHPENVQTFMLTNSKEFDSNGVPIKLAVWYIPPLRKEPHQESESNSSSSTNAQKDWFTDNKMVVLYIHGQYGTRAVEIRMRLYKRLSSELGLHVVAFDYRGFAESSKVRPTADGITRDARLVYDWILAQGVTLSRVIVWGHSLGSAVTVRMLSQLADEANPLATVLESPFTCLAEAIAQMKTARLFHHLPWFECCFVHPFTRNVELNFDSIALLPRVRTPLLIVHAEDDEKLSFEMGKKLYDSAVCLQPKAYRTKATLHLFPAKCQYGHNGICMAPDLIQIVTRFVPQISTDNSTNTSSSTF